MKKYTLIAVALGAFGLSAFFAQAKTLDQVILDVKAAKQEVVQNGAVLGAAAVGNVVTENGAIQIPTEKTQFLIEDLRNVSGKPVSEVISKTARFGETSEEVKKLQTFLIIKGFLATDEPTTYFGTKTKEALQKFQKSRGIVGDGETAGPLTRRALAEAY